MRTRNLNRLSAAAIFCVTLLTACQPNQNILKSSPSPVPEASLEPRKTTLATDIKDMEVAGLEHIFILRRKDGGVFDKDDKQFLRENAPVELLNRRVASDEGKTFVFGTNFIVPPEIVKTWRQRFSVEERNAAPETKPKNSK